MSLAHERCNRYLRIVPRPASSLFLNDFYNKHFSNVNQVEFPYAFQVKRYRKAKTHPFSSKTLKYLDASSNKHGFEMDGETSLMTYLVNDNKYIITVDMHSRTIRLRKVPSNFYKKYYRTFFGHNNSEKYAGNVYEPALLKLVETPNYIPCTEKFNGNDIKLLITDCKLIHEITLSDNKRSVWYEFSDVLYGLRIANANDSPLGFSKEDAELVHLKM